METRLRTLKTAASGAPPPVARASSEARREPRKTAYRFARVLTASGVAYNCIIRDFHAHGARVVFEGLVALPERVTLKIDQTGETRKARVAWQRENEAGLAF